MKFRALSLLAVFFVCTPVQKSQAANSNGILLNFEALSSSLGFAPYYARSQNFQRPKISILDRGFAGYKSVIGKSISTRTTYFHGTHESAEEQAVENEVHGLYMAKLVYAFMTENGKKPELEPELYLHDAYGFYNFQDSVKKAIELKSDVILYSQVWDYFDNFDGTGMINPVVSQATQAGIIWVNAAGNYGRNVFNIQRIETTDEGWVKLPESGNTLSFKCTPPDKKGCLIRIVLSWNSFPAQPGGKGTNKDLDISLYDPSQPVAIRASNLIQKEEPTQSVGESKYARDIIEAQVVPGLYYLKIKNKSLNFGSKDRARVAVFGDFVDLTSADVKENVFNPANISDVITVGAEDDLRSSSSVQFSKPEVKLPSMVQFADLKVPAMGSSTAAAIAVAGIGLSKGYDPSLKSQDVRRKTIWSGKLSLGRGLLIDDMGFKYTGTNCFKPVNFPNTPPHIIAILSQGGVMVETSHGFKIAVDTNPLIRAPGAPSTDEKLYRVFITLDGSFRFTSRNTMIAHNPADATEIFQIPMSQSICGYQSGNSSSSDKAFQLP
jgi:hypothetical protein